MRGRLPRLLFLLALVLLLTLLALRVELPIEERATPLLHFAAGLALTLALAWSIGTGPWRAGLCVIALSVALEPLQSLITFDRRADLTDALAGSLGALLGALLLQRGRRGETPLT